MSFLGITLSANLGILGMGVGLYIGTSFLEVDIGIGVYSSFLSGMGSFRAGLLHALGAIGLSTELDVDGMELVVLMLSRSICSVLLMVSELVAGGVEGFCWFV